MAGFQDIIGQEQICEHLQTALKLQKVSHAYIINGERNSGKKFIARIFAMALQCTGEGEKPCQVCRSCRRHFRKTIRILSGLRMKNRTASV